jgi:hypothetical protein
MRLAALLLSLVLVVAAPRAQAEAYPVVTLTPAQAQADIALMRRGLETIHPGLYRYRSRAEIDAAFARLEAVARAPMTDLDLWRETALMLAEIRCDHTKPEPSEAIERWRRDHPTHLPLRFTLIEGRMIVVSNDGQAGAPPPGAEILAINGRPTPVVLSTLARAVAYDGDADQAIAAKLASDSDLMGDDFNEYWPAFYGFPEAWRLEWKRAGDTTLSRSDLAPIRFPAWTALPWPGESYRDEVYKAVTWKLSGKTAYLRIDTFVNYRNPVDATAFLGGFFKALKASGATRLILDLRHNGGGSEDVSVALGRYLLTDRFVWSKPARLKAVRYGDLADHIESWGDRKAVFEPDLRGFRRLADGTWERLPRPGDEDDESALPQAVSPDRFKGELIVLTGPRNGSGATRTIAQLKERRAARLVGEDAAGSAEGPTAGRIFLMTLPASGLKVRIPNAWNRTNIKSFTPRQGVAAEVQVTPVVLDAQAGRDRTLEVARAVSAGPAPVLSRMLAGDWTGTLDYRDFGHDRRVILPTRASVVGQGGEVRLSLVFDDGPGKIVRTAETWSIAGDSLTIAGEGAPQVFRILENRGDGPGRDATLMAEGAGSENGVAVQVRILLARRGDRVSISRQSRTPRGLFLMRDAYDLRRTTAPPTP